MRPLEVDQPDLVLALVVEFPADQPQSCQPIQVARGNIIRKKVSMGDRFLFL